MSMLDMALGSSMLTAAHVEAAALRIRLQKTAST